jgi:hypothetical protein
MRSAGISAEFARENTGRRAPLALPQPGGYRLFSLKHFNFARGI